VDRLFERFSRLKGRDLHRRDLDLLRRIARIDAGAGGALTDAERPEPGKHHIIALLQVFRDGVEDGFKRIGSGFFGDAGGLRDGIDYPGFLTRQRLPGRKVPNCIVSPDS
jgi:hypothetical protein